MATKPRAVPASNGARRRKRTAEQNKRLASDALLRRINARRKRIMARIGILPDSSPLIREDRER